MKANSTQENKQEVIKEVDVLLQDSKSEFDSSYLMLEKAYALISNRSSDNAASAKEGKKMLDTVFLNTKDKKEYGFLNERALFGFVFAFAETCFPTSVTKYINQQTRSRYFSANASELEKLSAEGVQSEIFKFFIRLVDDDNQFKRLRGDKGFNGYSAYIKSVYLDSYIDNLPKVEQDLLVKSIKKDIEESKTGGYIDVSSSSMRMTMIVPMHLALADYVVKFRESNITDYSELERVNKMVSGLNADPTGKALIQTWIKLYILGAQEREKAPESKVNQQVAELEGILKNNPQIIELVRAYLSYGLIEKGRWLDIKQDLFILAKRNKALANFFDVTIGLKDY